MKRCLPFLRTRQLSCTLALIAAGVVALPPLTAHAQVQGGVGLMRNFPDAALRGQLIITGASDATINGQPIRMAPGMRLFSPQNTLILAHQVLGREFMVNYLIENSTGMLLSAWILTQSENAVNRKGGDAVITNYRSEYDAATDAAKK